MEEKRVFGRRAGRAVGTAARSATGPGDCGGGKRIDGYGRVSDPSKQAGERNVSLETQRARWLEYCKKVGGRPGRFWVDTQTGRRDDRRDYQRMLAAARAGEMSTLVVQFLDRFGRRPQEILTRYWELASLGVKIVVTDEVIENELLLLLKAGFAGLQWEMIRDKVSANIPRAVERGMHPGRPPYGVRGVRGAPDPKTGRTRIESYELEPREVAVLRRMRDLLVGENYGCKRLADVLNEAGERTRAGNLWEPTTIKRVLSNESLRGALVWGLRPRPGNPPREIIRIEGFYPRVFSDEEFAEIQRVLAGRRTVAGQTNSSVYILSGIARCGHCGGPLTGKPGARRRKGKGRYRNYWCRNHQRSAALCSHSNGHAQGRLERAVLQALAAFADREVAQARLEEELGRQRAANEVEDTQAELASVEAEIAAIDEEFLVQMRLLSRRTITEAQFEMANADAQARRQSLAARREELHRSLTGLTRRHERLQAQVARVQSFLEDFTQLTPQGQKARLQAIMEAVLVWEDGRIEIVCRE